MTTTPTTSPRHADVVVVDASIMPRVTTGNMNAPTMVIAEKGAAAVANAANRES